MTEGKKAVWKPTRVRGNRKIDRSVAQHNMKKLGMRRFNKPNRATALDIGGSPGRGSKRSGSVFAEKWKQYC